MREKESVRNVSVCINHKRFRYANHLKSHLEALWDFISAIFISANPMLMSISSIYYIISDFYAFSRGIFCKHVENEGRALSHSLFPFLSYTFIRFLSVSNIQRFSIFSVSCHRSHESRSLWFLRYHIWYFISLTPIHILFLHLLYAKIKVTDDVTIFDILDNRDQGISNALVNSQATQSVVTAYDEGDSGKHCWSKTITTTTTTLTTMSTTTKRT